jgi:hypothetical protein
VADGDLSEYMSVHVSVRACMLLAFFFSTPCVGGQPLLLALKPLIQWVPAAMDDCICLQMS